MAHRSNHAPASILVVDDEPAILELVSQFLEKRGYRVAGAATAADAVALASNDRFDVALLDLKLPDRAGIDLISPLSETNPGIACIVMTAFASVESTIAALRLNAFDYVLKPFDLVKIGETVDAAVQHARMRSESEAILARLEVQNRALEEGKEALARELARINEELRRANELLKRHVTRLRVLYQMGREISSNENWSDALDRFLMALCRYLDAEGAALLLFSNNAQVLKVRTAYQLEPEFVDDAVERLADAQRSDLLPTEIISLDRLRPDAAPTCLSMTAPWTHTTVPLLYKNRWLGFLIVRKAYRSRSAYMDDYYFFNTIQTILAEEVANAVNISRLRQLKDFNETVLENMNGGVLATDGAGRIEFMNERARELAGGACRGAALDDLFVNPFGQAGIFQHLLSLPEESRSFESLLSRPLGRSIPVRLNTKRVMRDEHHGRTVIAVFEDLTEQKRMEEELRRADRLRSLGELSAGIAHEIRNPLTGIATTAQVLREKLAGDRGHIAYIDVILGEIARLDGIIKSFLAFARPVAPRPEELALGSLVSDAVDLVKDRARGVGVEIGFDNLLGDDRCVLDGDQIKQVILNIALNGIQACGPGGRVTIRLREAADPAYVELEFADTGPGIAEEIADRLYDPFFTTRSEGTGMGLSISRKIAESHGGRIGHESAPGAGARFFVVLPRMTLAAVGPIAAPAAN